MFIIPMKVVMTLEIRYKAMPKKERLKIIKLLELYVENLHERLGGKL